MSETIEQIRRAFDEDQASGRKAVDLGDVPPSYEAITPEWMTAVLCRDIPGAQVTRVTLGEASHGSSNRQRILLEYNEAGRSAGLPPSVFCKGAMALANRLLLGSAATSEAEPAFFNKLRHRLAIQTPEPIHAAYDPRTYGYIIVMKDLTGVADFFDEATPVDRARAEDMARTLATFHATFYESPELGTDSLPFMHWSDWSLHGFTQFPDYAEACDLGFEQAESVIPPRLFARRSEIWPRTLDSIEAHRRLPRTVIHCDVHLKNWFELGGRVGLMDWQCITIGHWSRDFIYAMTTSLTPENRRAWLDDLLDIYLDTMAAAGVPRIGHDEAMRLCRQQLMTVLSFWTITLRPASIMPDMQPGGTTMTFLARIAAAMDELEALDAF